MGTFFFFFLKEQLVVSMETISTLNNSLWYFEGSKLVSNRHVSSASSWISKPSRSRILPPAELGVSQSGQSQVEEVYFLISAARHLVRLPSSCSVFLSPEWVAYFSKEPAITTLGGFLLKHRFMCNASTLTKNSLKTILETKSHLASKARVQFT